jgi:hypothetical protein
MSSLSPLWMRQAILLVRAVYAGDPGEFEPGAQTRRAGESPHEGSKPSRCVHRCLAGMSPESASAQTTRTVAICSENWRPVPQGVSTKSIADWEVGLQNDCRVLVRRKPRPGRRQGRPSPLQPPLDSMITLAVAVARVA